MNKKILIATIFATLMLLVPINSVVGVSDVEEDCGCQVVNRYDWFRVKLLSVRLKVVTNILLLRFGHIPEVREKCQEILEIINSDDPLEVPFLCVFLFFRMVSLDNFRTIIYNLMKNLPENSYMYRIPSLLFNRLNDKIETLMYWWEYYDCSVFPW